MDLAFKFHYIRGLYFFNNNSLEIFEMKKLTCQWLMNYVTTCGRIHVPESGRPFIKLNDAGVRLIEAKAATTIDEWLSMGCSLQHKLVPDHAREGFELAFTPLVFLQVTHFKCGGMSIGLSWAHVLGDIFSASSFMNSLGQSLQGNHPSKPLDTPVPPSPRCSRSVTKQPFSFRRVDPIEDTWIPCLAHKMVTHTFHMKQDKLDKLYSSTVYDPSSKDYNHRHIQPFELISAIFWKCIARIRETQPDLSIVTLCRSKISSAERQKMIPYNGLEVDIVNADFVVLEADMMRLALALVEGKVEEADMIEEMVEDALAQGGKCDFIIYGAKLTFIDMEGADVYGFQVKGQKPIFASYSIGYIGEEGAILVGDGPEIIDGERNNNNGRLVTAILPDTELEQLKIMLERDWDIV